MDSGKEPSRHYSQKKKGKEKRECHSSSFTLYPSTLHNCGAQYSDGKKSMGGRKAGCGNTLTFHNDRPQIHHIYLIKEDIDSCHQHIQQRHGIKVGIHLFQAFPCTQLIEPKKSEEDDRKKCHQAKDLSKAEKSGIK